MKASHLRAQRHLDRIEPFVEKSFAGHISRRLHAIFFHPVISIGASAPILFVDTTRRLRLLQISTTFPTAARVLLRLCRGGQNAVSQRSILTL